MLTRMPSNRRTAARGVSLIVVLIILVIVTIIGIAGARIALLGERSTRFDRDYQVAWEAAEAALVDAEYDIQGPNTSANARTGVFNWYKEDTQTQLFVAGCGNTDANRGLCLPAVAGQPPVWQASGFDFVTESGSQAFVTYGARTGRALPSGNAGVQPALRPHYIIECCFTDPEAGNSLNLGSGQRPNTFIVYRITSIGFGPNQQTQVMMQSIYAKDPNL